MELKLNVKDETHMCCNMIIIVLIMVLPVESGTNETMTKIEFFQVSLMLLNV